MKILKNYFIYPRFQFPVLGMIIFIFLLFLGVLYYQVEKSSEALEVMGSNLGLGQDHLFFNYIKAQKKDLMTKGVIALGLGHIILGFLIIYFSRKIVGPIVRLEGHLKNYLNSGEYTDLQFRRNDFFKEIPRLMNEIIRGKSN